MSSDSVKCPEDHDELQPQDVDNVPNEDPMKEFEAIYNKMKTERLEKENAEWAEEQERRKRKNKQAETCAIF